MMSRSAMMKPTPVLVFGPGKRLKLPHVDEMEESGDNMWLVARGWTLKSGVVGPRSIRYISALHI